MSDNDTCTQHSQQLLTDVRVGEAMHRGVVTCEREASLQRLHTSWPTARFTASSSKTTVVTAARFWGVVSDLDLVAAATVRDLDDQTAGGTAASPVVMVTPTETLERAAQLMTEHSTSHLVVVDAGLLRPVARSQEHSTSPQHWRMRADHAHAIPYIPFRSGRPRGRPLRRRSDRGARSGPARLGGRIAGLVAPSMIPRSLSTSVRRCRACFRSYRGRRMRRSFADEQKPSRSMRSRRSWSTEIRFTACSPRSTGGTQHSPSSVATASHSPQGSRLVRHHRIF